MSQTEIYVVRHNGDVIYAGCVNNAFRGALAVWADLGKKYGIISEPGDLLLDQKKQRLVWNLYKDARMTEAERLVMETTFDRKLARREDIPKVVAAYRRYMAEGHDPNCSIGEQADEIERILGFEGHDCIGIGWNQISVNGDMWVASEEADYYNVNSQNKHRWLELP